MHKLIPPLMGLAVSSFFLYRVVSNLPNPVADGATSKASSPTSTATDSPREQQSAESPHVAVIRFLTDMDDLLDQVHDRASFAVVKPKLLARAKQHATLAATHANQGLTQLSPAAAKQFQTAVNRHTESLGRAIEAVREVEEFFARDMAAILTSR